MWVGWVGDVLRTSSGPKTSRAWKPGKTRTPKWMGMALVFVMGGIAGMASAAGRAPRREVTVERRMLSWVSEATKRRNCQSLGAINAGC